MVKKVAQVCSRHEKKRNTIHLTCLTSSNQLPNLSIKEALSG